jgi:type I restriction enzyme S subunit
MKATKPIFESYKVYKESHLEWLSQLPSHWGLYKLNSIGTFWGGTGFPHEFQGILDSELPFYKVEDMNNLGNEKYMIKHNNSVSYKTAEKLRARILTKDIIIFPKVGAALLSNKRRLLTRHSIVDNNIMGLEIKRGLPSYYYYWLQLLDFGQLSNPGPVPSINEQQLKELPAIFPSIDEQQKIGQFLDRETVKFDNLIAKKKRLIELLKEKRQATISQVVTKGLDPNMPMKESGSEWLGMVPAHWKVSRIDREALVKARLGWKGLKASEYLDEGYIFLSTPNIKGTTIDYINVNHISEERYLESPEIMLRNDDVLLAKDGSTLGISNVVRELPHPATVNSSIAVIRPNKGLSGVFLNYFIKSNFMQHIIQQFKDGMGVPHLFQKDINKFLILVPPIEEQLKINDLLDQKVTKLEAISKKLEIQITKIKEYRQALISAAVTGKIDVRDEV